MRIDLSNLLSGAVDSIDIEHTVDLSELTYGTYNPVRDGARAVGRAYSKAGVCYLKLGISYDFYGVCDRCAEDVKKHFDLELERIIVEKLENEEDDDDYIIADDRCIDIDELVSEEVALSMPNKILCSEDCKGLCMQCGANLNRTECGCKPEVDPRLSALLQLLDNEE